MSYQVLFWGLDNLLISLCSPFKKNAQNTSTAPFLPHAQLINPSVCISGFSLQHLAEYCNLLKQPVLGKQIATPRLRFSFKCKEALNKSPPLLLVTAAAFFLVKSWTQACGLNAAITQESQVETLAWTACRIHVGKLWLKLQLVYVKSHNAFLNSSFATWSPTAFLAGQDLACLDLDRGRNKSTTLMRNKLFLVEHEILKHEHALSLSLSLGDAAHPQCMEELARTVELSQLSTWPGGKDPSVGICNWHSAQFSTSPTCAMKVQL